MPSELTDEYFTNALIADAAKTSIKYSALSHAPRRSGLAPRANTRFLRNILKETDSHNNVLLAKEKRDARERQRAMRGREEGRLSPPPDSDQRDRRKKLRSSQDDELLLPSRRRLERHDDRDSRDTHRRRLRSQPRSRSRSRSPRRRTSRRHTDGSNRRSRHRSRDAERPRQCSVTDSKPKSYSSKELQNHRRFTLSPVKDHGRSRRSPSVRSESDPLEAFVGPLPPPPPPKVRARGRGAFSASSAMDEHFDTAYNPKTDVQVEPDEEDDWDQAMEALRDRQRWKQQGAERLKAAGFSDAAVKKWEKGGEKEESDVQWARKGEGREWDRGKVVGEDGVELVAEWGRLKCN